MPRGRHGRQSSANRPAGLRLTPAAYYQSNYATVVNVNRHCESSGSFTSIDVVRVAMQIRTVLHVAQGGEDLPINAVFDAMHRAIDKHGLDPGRPAGAKFIA